MEKRVIKNKLILSLLLIVVLLSAVAFPLLCSAQVVPDLDKKYFVRVHNYEGIPSGYAVREFAREDRALVISGKLTNQSILDNLMGAKCIFRIYADYDNVINSAEIRKANVFLNMEIIPNNRVRFFFSDLTSLLPDWDFCPKYFDIPCKIEAVQEFTLIYWLTDNGNIVNILFVIGNRSMYYKGYSAWRSDPDSGASTPGGLPIWDGYIGYALNAEFMFYAPFHNSYDISFCTVPCSTINNMINNHPLGYEFTQNDMDVLESESWNFGYDEGMKKGQSVGYKQGIDFANISASFIPNVIGSIGTFLKNILSFNIFGISAIEVIGTIGAILLIVFVIRLVK